MGSAGLGARLLRPGTVIELPLTTRRSSTRDVRWVVPPRPDGWTDPDRLYQERGGSAPSPAARTPLTRKKPAKKKMTEQTPIAAS
ncbi:hypothetical protein [Streptomyces sp. NPDC049585]|uniref:hypothetical protein n=1 Tax=Streptomyces sp. NPDC049585 TaxID=3155154 RepID=UPI003416E217